MQYLLIEKTHISSNFAFLHMQTHCRGNLGACNVRLENPAHPVRYRGVVCSMKENFGFIERADVVKEIFFHFSEAKSMKEELRLGDDVEFIIQTRNVSEIKINKAISFLKNSLYIYVTYTLNNKESEIQYFVAGKGGSLQHYKVTTWFNCI